MSFDFLGTFSKQDLEGLQSYLQAELDKVDAQVNHMVMETDKLQKTLQTLLDYAQKHGIKLKIFGQALYTRLKTQYDDSDSAIIVQMTKEPYYRNLKQRENIEIKIKKIMDKIEQIQEQIYILRISKTEFTTNIQKLNSMFDATHPYLTVET